jgi:hypothetical protein
MLKKIFIPIVLLASFSFGFKTNVDTLKLRKFKSNHITYVKTSDSILDTTGIIYDNKFTCFPGNILGLNTSNPMLSSYELYNNYFRSSATDSNVFTKKVVAKDTLFALSHLQVNGEIYNQGITWTSRTSAADNSWRSICYGNGLFVACASTGTGNRIMTSPDGITWTSRTSAVDNDWYGICYGNGLFVIVGVSGSGQTVMTSPDGITWTSRTSAASNDWMSICYGNGLFVACASTGTGNRIMTSPNGITWTSRTPATNNDWLSICYGNGVFVCVSNTGTGNRVMTSPDGITWTSRTSSADNSWRSICYGNGLFVACASTGTGNRIMTSPNGITWTSRTPAVDNDWRSICYGNGLFVACASTGTGNRIMTSPDGITWTSRTSAADNSWMSICYGNGVFVAISFSGTGNRVMTSGKSTKLITSDNNIYHGGIISTGTVSTDSLYSINGIKSNRGTFSSNIGVGSNSSLAAVDISYGGSTLALGGDLNAYTRTDNTDKFSKISLVHYDIDEEPICVAYMACGSGSVLNVGGGASSLNAIMGIDFYTADAVNTLTGTKRVGIASDGSVTIGAPTGGGKGAGTINAVAVYDDNVLLTGYVFDKYFNQNFDISKWNKNDTNNSLNPIRQPATEFIKHSDVCFNRKLYWNYIREKRVLPTMADVEDSSRIPSIGSLAQRLWETAEIQAIHTLQQDILIDSLTARIIALENKSNP